MHPAQRAELRRAVQTTENAFTDCPFVRDKNLVSPPSLPVPTQLSIEKKVVLIADQLYVHGGVTRESHFKVDDVITLAKKLGLLQVTWPEELETPKKIALSVLNLLWTSLAHYERQHPEQVQNKEGAAQELEDLAFKQFMGARARESESGKSPYHLPGMDDAMETLDPRHRRIAFFCRKLCCASIDSLTPDASAAVDGV